MEIGLQQPVTVFEDNKGASDMFRSGRVTSNLKHLDIPLQIIHEEHEKGAIMCVPCLSHCQWADTFTKQAPGPLSIEHRNWYTGKRFHPPVYTDHHKLLSDPVLLS